jgi:hypothetical protein
MAKRSPGRSCLALPQNKAIAKQEIEKELETAVRSSRADKK